MLDFYLVQGLSINVVKESISVLMGFFKQGAGS